MAAETFWRGQSAEDDVTGGPLMHTMQVRGTLGGNERAGQETEGEGNGAETWLHEKTSSGNLGCAARGWVPLTAASIAGRGLLACYNSLPHNDLLAKYELLVGHQRIAHVMSHGWHAVGLTRPVSC